MNNPIQRQQGLSLVEITITLAIAALVMIAINGVIGQALETERIVRNRNDVHQQARFAMQQMVRAVSHTQRLLLPLAENPATAWSESVRDPGVLAVTLDPTLDRDKDGWADVDNDKDGQIDEDIGSDNNNDLAAGIVGIDDDNDGNIDESNKEDDDEDEDNTGNKDEDPINGIDDDGDGSIDEDFSADMNGDGYAGLEGEDDDNDGTIDESNQEDDDEDEDTTGNKDEDWFDPVVYFLNGTTLMQRIPNINPTDGTDYGEYPIAENVSQFRVERIPQGAGRAVLIDLSLTVTDSNGESAQLNTRVRVGSGL